MQKSGPSEYCFIIFWKLYSVSDLNPGNIKIHCESSVWTKTIYDPYVNILRNTTEAMSAILGGCNSISISPFDEVFSNSTDFSKRISRNISNLLKEESYFDKVSDPAAGSFYIEELTDKLVESGLAIFKEIENEGGFVQAFEKGTIKNMMEASRDKKHDLTSKRREVYIGTNQYPNTNETIDPSELKIKKSNIGSDTKLLTRSRGAEQFEKLPVLKIKQTNGATVHNVMSSDADGVASWGQWQGWPARVVNADSLTFQLDTNQFVHGMRYTTNAGQNVLLPPANTASKIICACSSMKADRTALKQSL